MKKKQKCRNNICSSTASAPSAELPAAKVTWCRIPRNHRSTQTTPGPKGLHKTFITNQQQNQTNPPFVRTWLRGVTMKGQLFDPDALLKQIKLIVRMESLKQTSILSIERVFVRGERRAAALRYTGPGVQLVTCEGGSGYRRTAEPLHYDPTGRRNKQTSASHRILVRLHSGPHAVSSWCLCYNISCSDSKEK